jgi:hypothetical protein
MSKLRVRLLLQTDITALNLNCQPATDPEFRSGRLFSRCVAFALDRARQTSDHARSIVVGTQDVASLQMLVGQILLEESVNARDVCICDGSSI